MARTERQKEKRGFDERTWKMSTVTQQAGGKNTAKKKIGGKMNEKNAR